MTADAWTEIDAWLCGLLVPPDPVLDGALAASAAAGLPDIAVAPNQGKLLMLLAQLAGARRILEIGTLGGYSTIWLARALPDRGRLVTLEYEPLHAEVARGNIARAGLAEKVDIRVGRAVDTLAAMEREGGEAFDMVFIDADKPSNPDYLAFARRLTRAGGLIVADNVVRRGAVTDAASTDANIVGIRRFLEMVATDPRLEATALQTVGSKGHDGLAVIRVVG